MWSESSERPGRCPVWSYNEKWELWEARTEPAEGRKISASMYIPYCFDTWRQQHFWLWRKQLDQNKYDVDTAVVAFIWPRKACVSARVDEGIGRKRLIICPLAIERKACRERSTVGEQGSKWWTLLAIQTNECTSKWGGECLGKRWHVP